MGVFQANASGMPDYSKRVSLISMESIRGLLKTGKDVEMIFIVLFRVQADNRRKVP
jgi:hypothetical protein